MCAKRAAVLPSEKLVSSLSGKITFIFTGNDYVHNVGVNSSLTPGREHDTQEFLTFLLDHVIGTLAPE